MESTTRRIVLVSILLIFALAVFLTMNYLHTGRREYYSDGLTEEDILKLKAQEHEGFDVFEDGEGVSKKQLSNVLL